MTRNNNHQTDWHEGEYIIYQNGNTYEIGRIKSIRNDGAFVAYHEGETGAKTPFDCMHRIRNDFTIKKTSLAWEYFDDAAVPAGERREDGERD